MPKKPTIPKSKKPVIAGPTIEELQSEKSMLEKQVDDLKKAVYRLQLERNVLEKSAEILKKIRASIWLPFETAKKPRLLVP